MGLAAKNTSHQEIIPADNSEPVEVVVHIGDDLGKQQQNALLARMSDESGILEASIDAFKESNLDARLIISI